MDGLYYEDPLTQLYCGDAREVLAGLTPESVHMVVTSPPYWGLRDYKIPPLVWGGQADCEHEWGAQLNERKRGSLHGTNAQAGNTLSGISGTGVTQGQFCAKCGAWRGSLGLEPSPELYVQHLVEVFRAVKRVLRPDGTVWLNMGDSYAGSNCGSNDYRGKGASISANPEKYQGQKAGVPVGLKPLDLCGMPWRVAFALQADGWYLRSDIIWAKPNPMPESVSGSRWEQHRVKVKSQGEGTSPQRVGSVMAGVKPQRNAPGGVFQDSAKWEDCPGCPVCLPNDGLVLRKGSWRPTVSHEYVFMLAKSQNYYADGEAVREINTENSIERWSKNPRRAPPKLNRESIDPYDYSPEMHLVGRNKRSVWEITTQSFSGQHFATFPEKLVEPCLLAGTSERGACPKCGKAWVRVIEHRNVEHKREPAYQPGNTPTKVDSTGWEPTMGATLGWRAACSCNAGETIPCQVLDPFAGSGTVGVVARQWGRFFIGIELSEKYCQLAVERLTGTQPVLVNSSEGI